MHLQVYFYKVLFITFFHFFRSLDDLSSDWLPFGNHSKNSKDRGKNRNQANSRKLRSNSKWPAGPSSTRLFKQSQRSKQVSDQIQNNSKRKRQVRNN